MNDLETVRQIIDEVCLRFGRFTLSSGGTSSFYIDMRKALLRSDCLYVLAAAVRRYLAREDVKYTAIAAPALGAVPLMAAMLALDGFCDSLASEIQPPVDTARWGLMVRKETKGHGTKKRVEGWCPPDARILVVEDVLTTGTSVLSTIEAVQEEITPTKPFAGVLCLLDRREGGQKAVEALEIPLFRLATPHDLPRLQEHLAAMRGT